MHNTNWDDLRFVIAVAEAGSLSRAASATGVNHATVMRRVAAFEGRKSMQVFLPARRGYQTAPGVFTIA